MKKPIVSYILVALILTAAYFLISKSPTKPTIDYSNTTFSLNDRKISLKDEDIKIVKEIQADFDDTKTTDIAVLFTMETSTTTLYYLAAALQTNNGYIGTPARIIGNQVSIQSLEWVDGHISVNYYDRRPGEPITAEPKFIYQKKYAIRNNQLVRALGI